MRALRHLLDNAEVISNVNLENIGGDDEEGTRTQIKVDRKDEHKVIAFI